MLASSALLPEQLSSLGVLVIEPAVVTSRPAVSTLRPSSWMTVPKVADEKDVPSTADDAGTISTCSS